MRFVKIFIKSAVTVFYVKTHTEMVQLIGVKFCICEDTDRDGAADRREVLHGGRAASQKCLLPL